MFTKYPTFEEAVKATGKKFTYEQSICGSYHLFCDGELIIDGSACEDLNGTEQDAKDFFANYLLEYEVPNEKKIPHFGSYLLK